MQLVVRTGGIAWLGLAWLEHDVAAAGSTTKNKDKEPLDSHSILIIVASSLGFACPACHAIAKWLPESVAGGMCTWMGWANCWRMLQILRLQGRARLTWLCYCGIGALRDNLCLGDPFLCDGGAHLLCRNRELESSRRQAMHVKQNQLNCHLLDPMHCHLRCYIYPQREQFHRKDLDLYPLVERKFTRKPLDITGCALLGDSSKRDITL
jgi:hypothetical protein